MAVPGPGRDAEESPLSSDALVGELWWASGGCGGAGMEGKGWSFL